jgi:hypothetical protein
MVLIRQLHESIMMNAPYAAGFQGLNDEPAGDALKETGNGHEKLVIQCQPLGYFLIVFMVKYADGPFFDVPDVIGYPVLTQYKMIFGIVPLLPGLQKKIPHPFLQVVNAIQRSYQWQVLQNLFGMILLKLLQY